MKNLVVYILMIMLTVSCSKTELKQTSDTIKTADSLFTKANSGLKTLDSISKIVNDTAKFNKVVAPHIEKTKKTVEKAIQENAYTLDSVNAVLQKAKSEIEKNTDLIKTVDSAGQIINRSNKPSEILSAISKTLEKVSSATTRSETPQTPSAPETAPTEQQPLSEPTAQAERKVQPLVKTAELGISVTDLNPSKNLLESEIRRYGGQIISENFGEENGFRKQIIRARIPTSSVDIATRELPGMLGQLTMRSVISSGTDPVPGQMSDLQITLTENRIAAGAESMQTDGAQGIQKEESSYGSAFMKGFDVLEKIFLALLPFWPVLLILLLIWYLVRRNRRKKAATTVTQERFPTVETPSQETHKQQEASPQTDAQNPEPGQQDSPPEDPYEKYRPR